MSPTSTFNELDGFERARSRAGQVAAVGLLVTFLALGTWLRLAQLGHGDFAVDEIFQVFAAQEINATGEPRLPSGELYLRGIDVTRATSLSFRLFGTDELAARLPSALLGLLGLYAFAAVLWAFGGPWVAVVGTALFAVYPEAVRQSRELRFYTYQLLFGILALYTGWRALELDKYRPGSGADRLRQWAWIGATLVLLLLAMRAQVVTASVAVGWAVCVLLAAIETTRIRGASSWRSSPVVQLVLLGVVGVSAVLLLRPELLGRFVEQGRYTPYWVTRAEGGTTPLAYYYSLSDTYPLLLSLIPLLFVCAIARAKRLGLYLAIWFGVPLFLHSFVLTMKGARFILVPMLGLFAASAITLVWLGSALGNELLRPNGMLRHPVRFRRTAASLVVGAVFAFAFLTLPALHRSRKLVGGKSTRWSVAADIMRARPELAGIPIGHTQTLHPLFYWGRIDFELGDPARPPDDEAAAAPGELPIESRVGVPILHTAEQIRSRYITAGGVIVGLDSDRITAGLVDPALVRTLQSEAEELCRRRCDKLNLYFWRFGPVAFTPTDN